MKVRRAPMGSSSTPTLRKFPWSASAVRVNTATGRVVPPDHTVVVHYTDPPTASWFWCYTPIFCATSIRRADHFGSVLDPVLSFDLSTKQLFLCRPEAVIMRAPIAVERLRFGLAAVGPSGRRRIAGVRPTFLDVLPLNQMARVDCNKTVSFVQGQYLQVGDMLLGRDRFFRIESREVIPSMEAVNLGGSTVWQLMMPRGFQHIFMGTDERDHALLMRASTFF